MARVLMVHGAFNEFWGPHELKARWLPALRDGLGTTTSRSPMPTSGSASTAISFGENQTQNPGSSSKSHGLASQNC